MEKTTTNHKPRCCSLDDPNVWAFQTRTLKGWFSTMFKKVKEAMVKMNERMDNISNT